MLIYSLQQLSTIDIGLTATNNCIGSVLIHITARAVMDERADGLVAWCAHRYNQLNHKAIGTY